MIFVCHKSQDLKNKLESDDSQLYMIPPHYTGLFQPCDVGINKSLEDRLKHAASVWRCHRHTELTPGEKLKGPKRLDIFTWMKTMWDEFPINTVQNTFTGCGYVFENGIDYSMENESESDNE